jgi:hypothetical protein
VVNGQKKLPRSLDDLLEDRRFPFPLRHLRKRYIDPITNASDWGLIQIGDGIAGVFSLSTEEPLRKANFGACCGAFGDAKSYTEWKFVGATEPAPAEQKKDNATAAPQTDDLGKTQSRRGIDGT